MAPHPASGGRRANPDSVPGAPAPNDALPPPAELRFYAELRDFLPPPLRSGRVTTAVTGPRSIKDVIESFGVPHTEVDVIIVDGTSVDFDHRLAGGERVAIYPVFESFDIRELVRLRPAPLRRTRFVADGHLGTLARRLRLLGFDCVYAPDPSDDELVRISVDERRVLLTRDRSLLMRRIVTRGYCPRSDSPRQQLREVLARFQLADAVAPFSRCVACNGVLVAVAKSAVAHRLPPRTRAHYDEFSTCPDCGRDYWRGAHHDRLDAIVAEARAEMGEGRRTPAPDALTAGHRAGRQQSGRFQRRVSRR